MFLLLGVSVVFKNFQQLLAYSWLNNATKDCLFELIVCRSKQWDVIMKFHYVQPFKKATASKVCIFV